TIYPKKQMGMGGCLQFMNSIEKSIINVNKPTSLLYLARLRTKRELWAGSSGRGLSGNVKT
ncbi:hypothetical protein, partial [Lunatimonas lonarensis]|uniref:hypothetical protein n=1 Tax=Lunatimonas lonarensis TaxID=1232681 RepID=UPI001EE2540F